MIVGQLIEDHKWGRKTTGELMTVTEKYLRGDGKALSEIMAKMKALIEFYPRHIQKEDRRFFIPVMEYFSREEKDAMLSHQQGYRIRNLPRHGALQIPAEQTVQSGS